MALSKNQILSAGPKLQVAEVPVPEWGDGATVYVRELTGNERDVFEGLIAGKTGGDLRGFRARLAAMTLCDEGGELMGFSEAEVEQLGNKGSAAIDRIFETAKRLSGLDDSGVENAEKN